MVEILRLARLTRLRSGGKCPEVYGRRFVRNLIDQIRIFPARAASEDAGDLLRAETLMDLQLPAVELVHGGSIMAG